MRARILIRTAVLDVASFAVGAVVASLIVFETPLPWVGQPRIWPLLGYLFAGAAFGAYVSSRMWGNGIPRPSYGRAVAIAVWAVGGAALSLIATRAYFSRPFLGITAATSLGLMLAHRAYSRSKPWHERLILITAEKKLIDDLQMAPHADVVAVYDPAGDPPELPDANATLAVDLRAVLSPPMAQFVSSSNLSGIVTRSVASVYEEHTGRYAMALLAEGWELSAPVEQSSAYAPVKRVIDIVLVLLAAAPAAVLSAMIAVAVRLDSPGPVLFHQRRIGRHGAPFTLHKFRTMRTDAEANGARLAVRDDPRLTRFGRWLRKTRMDELPQLWNVLIGDLSLVGPRPEQPEFVAEFERRIPFYSHRHLVRPGITGWAQVNYGYADDEADTIEKLTFDLYYVRHMSFWLDMQVLGRSIWTVLTGFGAQ